MNRVQQILNRSIAAPFYRLHAGAFLFAFFILFGIQPSFNDALRTHYAIITGILSSPVFLLVAIGCWILYAMRAIAYLYSNLKKPAFDFLFDLNALPQMRKFGHLLKLILLLLLPLIAYGVIIFMIAVKEGLILKGLLVLLVIVVIAIVSTAVSCKMVGRAKALQQVVRSYKWIHLPPTLAGFLLRQVFREQFMALLLVKFLSFGCLYFFARIEASVFEERMLWMLFITALAGHATLIYKIFHFMEDRLGFYRNMPVRRIRILVSLVVVYAILLVPEYWALRGIATSQDNLDGYLWMVLTGASLLLLLHALLYTEDMEMEEYLKLVFGVWVVFVFISLSRSHWLLPAIATVFATIIFFMSYYNYEKNAGTEGLD